MNPGRRWASATTPGAAGMPSIPGASTASRTGSLAAPLGYKARYSTAARSSVVNEDFLTTITWICVSMYIYISVYIYI